MISNPITSRVIGQEALQLATSSALHIYIDGLQQNCAFERRCWKKLE
uniref:Uncharacterized protein n=1 Tax=Heterorhabditis bacteriophora TaxID=37862 RepID=A0A1I7XAN9_HETBA